MPTRSRSTESAAEVEPADAGFASLGLDPRLTEALAALGYEEPTPVQRAAIPPLLEGRDVLAQAATGTGKTAAFALPMLHRIGQDGERRDDRPSALILVPTRELAMQVAEAVHRYGKALGTRALPIYGGADMPTQLRALKRGVDVVVATPGRAVDHLRRASLRLDAVQVVVLDEADEMLDMGFADDLEAILGATPPERQTALFSATIPARITEIAGRHLREPIRLRVARESLPAGDAPRVRQVAYIVSRAHKMAALGRVLDIEHPTSAIVFCRTRTEVDELTETLNARGIRADALHGGMAQDQRDRVMKRFRGHKSDLLIATDVAARGLDVQHVSHVVNYDVPPSAEAYVHRIGRTGRAGREGVAITLAEPREHRLLRNIEQSTRQQIEIAPVPTVSDLRARRLELAGASLREAILGGEAHAYRGIVESLAEEFELMDIAAAAIMQAHAIDGHAEEDIPVATVREPRGERATAGARSGKPREGRGAARSPRKRAVPEWETTRIYVGAGRRDRVRPSDLVGAIANEVGIGGDAVGAIQISETHSLVEIPEEIADDIIEALRATTIKGRRVVVRRDRGKG